MFAQQGPVVAALLFLPQLPQIGARTVAQVVDHPTGATPQISGGVIFPESGAPIGRYDPDATRSTYPIKPSAASLVKHYARP